MTGESVDFYWIREQAARLVYAAMFGLITESEWKSRQRVIRALMRKYEIEAAP